jgi:tetratricopeptide (TPR) repeat protein
VNGTARRWERAEEPRLGPYCDALARGYTLLGSAPKEALDSARRAERILPGRAAPALLEARAQAALGAYSDAWTKFEAVQSRGVRVDAPSLLHAIALAALKTGHSDAALDAFRALVSRIDLLDDGSEQVRILIEAAVLAMSRGPAHVPEAVGYLSEARRRPRLPGLSDYVLAALAMALDRQGLSDEASGIAAESTGPWRLEADRDRIGKASDLPDLVPGEIDAMIALLAEHHDRELSLERWQSYLENGAASAREFTDWARKRRDTVLGKSKRKRSVP